MVTVEPAVNPHAAPAAAASGARRPLPSAVQLAALGIVACLYRSGAGGELAGWARAVDASCTCVDRSADGDGLDAQLRFHDVDGRCCWQLHLLPDSDFLAWEDVASALARIAPAPSNVTLADRLWSRLADRLRDGRWEVSILRLHALPGGPGFGATSEPPMLAASLAIPSSLGASVARRIARDHGAEATIVGDDCCCARAARNALRVAFGNPQPPGDCFPLVRLKPRESR